MQPRLNLYAVSQDGLKPLLALEEHLVQSGLDKKLMLLVKTRASQINGCAYCLHMHTSDALKEGESAARLFLLDAWEESKLYTAKERAALAWTDALTKVAETHAPDDVYEEVKAQFNEQEIANLTLLIASINSWNRLAIGLRAQHPHDKPAATAQAA